MLIDDGQLTIRRKTATVHARYVKVYSAIFPSFSALDLRIFGQYVQPESAFRCANQELAAACVL